MNTTTHYQSLFAPLEVELGPLGKTAATGIVGFSAGGPVSIVQAGEHGYVTCELSVYQEQVRSTEGENYELFCRMPLTESQAQTLLTGLGSLSMEVELGHAHTVDVAALNAAPGLSVVALRHFSSVVNEGRRFGVYEVTAT